MTVSICGMLITCLLSQDVEDEEEEEEEDDE